MANHSRTNWLRFALLLVVGAFAGVTAAAETVAVAARITAKVEESSDSHVLLDRDGRSMLISTAGRTRLYSFAKDGRLTAPARVIKEAGVRDAVMSGDGAKVTALVEAGNSLHIEV